MKPLVRQVQMVATAVAAAVTVVGCSSDPTPTASAPDVPATVALGELPQPLSPIGEAALAPSTTAAPATTPSTSEPDDAIPEIIGTVGAVAEGNRVLLIGDTALATLTTRQDGIGCETLSDFGWQTQIEAERGRFLAFADEVLDEVAVDAGERWDVVGLMFGHHVDVGPDEFRASLEAVVDRISPRLVVLYTVAPVTIDGDLSAEAVALNDEIRAVADARPNVVLVDWSQAIQDEQDVDLVDGFVPTTAGMERLVVMTAGALGDAPATPGGGACLESVFVDDSAILI